MSAEQELKRVRQQLAESEQARGLAQDILNSLVDSGSLQVRPSDRTHVIEQLSIINNTLSS